jgi:hypothetical protein
VLTSEQYKAVTTALDIIPALVHAGSSEEELDTIKTFLTQFEVVVRNAITEFDKNVVDVFLADVNNGVYGEDYKATLSRIHNAKGRPSSAPKERPMTPQEKLAALQAKLVG